MKKDKTCHKLVYIIPFIVMKYFALKFEECSDVVPASLHDMWHYEKLFQGKSRLLLEEI